MLKCKKYDYSLSGRCRPQPKHCNWYIEKRREPEIDFQTATTAGLSGLTDRQVLEIAAQAGRILVSHDQRTMPRYFAEFIINQTSPGLIIVPKKLSISEVIESLMIIWSASNTEEWVNRIIYLPV